MSNIADFSVKILSAFETYPALQDLQNKRYDLEKQIKEICSEEAWALLLEWEMLWQTYTESVVEAIFEREKQIVPEEITVLDETVDFCHICKGILLNSNLAIVLLMDGLYLAIVEKPRRSYHYRKVHLSHRPFPITVEWKDLLVDLEMLSVAEFVAKYLHPEARPKVFSGLKTS